MKFKNELFSDLYFKYAMPVVFLSLSGVLIGFIIYRGLFFKPFLGSNFQEIKIEKIYRERNTLYFNGEFTIYNENHKDIYLSEVLVSGSRLVKTSKRDSIIVIDKFNKVYSFVFYETNR